MIAGLAFSPGELVLAALLILNLLGIVVLLVRKS